MLGLVLRRSHIIAPSLPAPELPAQRTHMQIVPEVMASTGASGMETTELVADEKLMTPPLRPPLEASHVAPVTVATTPEPALQASEPLEGAVSKLSQNAGDGRLDVALRDALEDDEGDADGLAERDGDTVGILSQP